MKIMQAVTTLNRAAINTAPALMSFINLISG